MNPLIRLISLLAGGVFAISALAQSYPNKPIKLVVGYPPGGSGDFLTRLAADELTKELGARVIV
jgi:tripartite-type tricarboxylate transporter receptor subunit TctC